MCALHCQLLHVNFCVTGSLNLNSSVSEVHRKSTVGSLDMGGGSAQIAFEVGKSVSVCVPIQDCYNASLLQQS